MFIGSSLDNKTLSMNPGYMYDLNLNGKFPSWLYTNLWLDKYEEMVNIPT